MGARSGGGGGWSGAMKAGLMSGNSKAAHDLWNQAIQSTTGKLVAGTYGKKGVNLSKGPRKLTGAAKKNAQNTLKQLMNIHPTAGFTKAIKSGKVVGLDTSFLK